MRLRDLVPFAVKKTGKQDAHLKMSNVVSLLIIKNILSTERLIYYRKSALHLRTHMFHVRLSKCSTDLR